MKFLSKIACILCAVLILQSCENSENLMEDLQSETLTYELYEGKTMTFDVSSNIQHKSKTFDSLESFNDFLVTAQEENKPLTINKEMWEKLKHFWNPYEVSLFDKNYEITVGSKKYRIDEQATYIQNDHGVWEMDVFYGLSGDVDYEEVKMVSLNLDNLEVLKDYAFQSPSARKYYEEKLNTPPSKRTRTDTFSVITGGNFAFTTIYNDVANFQTNLSLLASQPYIVTYGPNFQLRNSKNLQTRAVLGVYCYNEEFRNNLTARANGETLLVIMDLDDGGAFVKDQWVIPCNNNQGYNPVNGTSYNACDRNSDVSLPYESIKPYTYVKVYAKNWREDFGHKWHARELGVRRRGGDGASSRHQVHFRPNTWTSNRFIYHRAIDRSLR